MTFGERIKELRIDARLTQRQLAEQLNIAPSTLSCYEIDERRAPYEVLIAIAKYFDVSTDYLLGLKDEY